jgi:hypothetical protein
MIPEYDLNCSSYGTEDTCRSIVRLIHASHPLRLSSAKVVRATLPKTLQERDSSLLIHWKLPR